MQKSNCLKLSPFTIDHEGRAIARDANNRVILIENALPESTVIAEILEEKKNFALAYANETITPSPHQTKALCPHAQKQKKQATCGGCVWQDLDYSKQLEYKAQIIKDALTRIGKIAQDNPLLNFKVKASKLQYNYRNKMEFAFSQNILGETIIGLKTAKSHEVIEVHCALCHKKIHTILHTFAKLCKNAKLPVYSEKSGYLRYLTTRSSEQKNILKELLLEVITYPDAQYNKKLYEILKSLQEQFPEITGIVHSIRKNSTNIAYGETVVATFGKAQITETLNLNNFKLSLNHSVQSFFQVNTYGAEDLYSSLAKVALSLNIKNICDIYCGVGGIGITIARAMQEKKLPYHLFGLEVSKQATKIAEENAKKAGIKATFTTAHAGKLAKFLKEVNTEAGSIDMIILDPPRAGVDKQSLEAITKAKIPHILMVSCNPATLARDITLLKNYTMIDLQAFDLFPHTAHVETFVLLTRI